MKKLTGILSTLIVATLALCFAGCNKPSMPTSRKTAEVLYAGKTDNLTPEEQEVENMLKETAALPKCSEYFKSFFTTAYLVLEDFDNLCFTVTINNGSATIKRGINPAVYPDLVVPLKKHNCAILLGILKDNVVTEEEEYQIFYTTFTPSYRSMIMKGAMDDRLIQKYLGIPDLIHVILKNDKNFKCGNTTRPMAATIAKTEGQWLVFEGLQGTPSMRMEVTVQQAKDFSLMISQALARPNLEKNEKKAALDGIKEFIRKVTVNPQQ